MRVPMRTTTARISGFYGSERRARSNESWDTIDPRLVQVLVAALPELRKLSIWEPAAGRGLMVEQLRRADAPSSARAISSRALERRSAGFPRGDRAAG